MNAVNATFRELRVPATATLIRRFHEHCSLSEIYDKAVRCHETLIDAVQDPSVAGEIASLLRMPAGTVRSHADAIITTLLFNEENDPYLSLGLPRHAPFQAVSRRRRRLIGLYHPDRSFNGDLSEEKTMKINERYEEIRSARQDARLLYPYNSFSEVTPPEKDPVFSGVYLKRIPALIIVLAVIVAVFSLSLLIFELIPRDHSTPPDGGQEQGLKIIPAEHTRNSRGMFL